MRAMLLLYKILNYTYNIYNGTFCIFPAHLHNLLGPQNKMLQKLLLYMVL